MKNIYNKTLKICSKKPITGYSRDGYCKPMYGDIGNHLICAKTDKQFLDYTARKGNNLYSVIKPGDKWCICQDRYFQALKDNKSPKVINSATSNKIKPHIKRLLTRKLRQQGGNLLPKLRKLSKKNKKYIYRIKDPQYKRILAIDEGINDNRNSAKMKKARFNVLRLYRKNKDKIGCLRITKDMKYMDKKYKLGNTKNICK